MSTKILLVIVAYIAGAATVFAYHQFTTSLTSSTRQQEEIRLAEVERQLAVLMKEVEDIKLEQHGTDSETETLRTRVSVLDELLSRLEKKRVSQPSAPESSAEAAPSETPQAQPDTPGGRRITGDELARALQDMPEEGRKKLREAIKEELQRIRQEQAGFETKEELGRKAEASIKSLTAALSLSPVQVEQLTDIVARQVERILESQRVAKERNNPEYAATERGKIRTDAERELVNMLTPEQMDKLRELDPEGFGKRYPRGF